MLARAIECVPPAASAEFRLALARIESFGNAQRVLNDAIKALPKDARMYIAGAQLVEGRLNMNEEEEEEEEKNKGKKNGTEEKEEEEKKKKRAKAENRIRKIMAMAAKKVGSALSREAWLER